mmetsp:Transcript_20688/g.40630  ORF Transcript_20688/g.40630 Transcript_20688/m.40630 type:complete len:275 (+) Transcript_20688:1813-2637(+)
MQPLLSITMTLKKTNLNSTCIACARLRCAHMYLQFVMRTMFADIPRMVVRLRALLIVSSSFMISQRSTPLLLRKLRRMLHPSLATVRKALQVVLRNPLKIVSLACLLLKRRRLRPRLVKRRRSVSKRKSRVRRKKERMKARTRPSVLVLRLMRTPRGLSFSQNMRIVLSRKRTSFVKFFASLPRPVLIRNFASLMWKCAVASTFRPFVLCAVLLIWLLGVPRILLYSVVSLRLFSLCKAVRLLMPLGLESLPLMKMSTLPSLKVLRSPSLLELL